MRETNIENFKAKFQERWHYPSQDKYDALLRLWPEGENPEAEKAVKQLREKSWRVDKSAERDLILEENVKWLSKKNPELSPAQARTLVSRYDSIPSLVFYDKNEYPLFSFYTANEFLAQDVHERYGDFLDENWDKLHGIMREGYFTHYGHTSRLFGLFTEKDSVLLHRPRSAKAVRDALENLTREDFSKLTKLEARKLKSSATLLPEHIKSLLVDEKPQVYKQDMLKDKLYVGFSKAVAAAGEKPAWSHLKLAHLLLKYLERIDRSFYENDRYAKPGKLPNSVLKPIADLIEKRGEEFMPYEILGVVFILTSPDVVISAPKLQGLRAFIPFPEVEEADQRQVLKLMGKLAVAYRGRIPTLDAWEKFLKSGDAALAMDHELMFELMGGPDVLRANILSKDLMEFRGSLPR